MLKIFNHYGSLFILILLTSFCMPVVAANNAPPPYIAHYSVRSHGLKIGNITRRLNYPKPRQYRLETLSKTSITLLNVMNDALSEGIIIGQRVKPLHYVSKEQIFSKKNVDSIDFQWQKKLAISRYDGGMKKIPIPANAMDELSYQLAMRYDLRHKTPPISYPVVKGKKIKNYHFELLSRETLSTALGRVKTLKLSYHHRHHTTVVWVSPRYDNLLVKLQQYKNQKLMVTATIRDYKLIQ